MTWTYDPSLPSAKDQVRSRIGDTDTTDQQLSDEEITGYLTVNGGAVTNAAVALCIALAGKYARQVDVAEDQNARAALSQMFTHYIDLAAELRREGESSSLLVAPLAGGVNLSGFDPYTGEDDPKPFFTREGP